MRVVSCELGSCFDMVVCFFFTSLVRAAYVSAGKRAKGRPPK